MIYAAILGAPLLVVIGMAIGKYLAEDSAVLHSDCSTPHHMKGGFYYIVPESEYVKLVMLKYQKHDPDVIESGN